jgi:hypothetical protein
VSGLQRPEVDAMTGTEPQTPTDPRCRPGR